MIIIYQKFGNKITMIGIKKCLTFSEAMWMNAWLFTIMIAAIIRDPKIKTGNERRFTGPYREENRKYPLGSQRNPIPEAPTF